MISFGQSRIGMGRFLVDIFDSLFASTKSMFSLSIRSADVVDPIELYLRIVVHHD